MSGTGDLCELSRGKELDMQVTCQNNQEVRGRGRRCALTVRTVPSDVVNVFGPADKATSLQ